MLISFIPLNKLNKLRKGRSNAERDGVVLLYTAELSVCVFGAKTEFRFVVFQVKQLL